MKKFTFVAPCLFGLEGLVADEARALGFENVAASDGRVCFDGDFTDLAKANLWLRYAERVLLKVGEYKATTFDQLFEGAKALPWENFIGREDAFPVKGHTLHSKLFSVSDCQSILKKALVERLKGKYGIAWFNETGAQYPISFFLFKDTVTLMIDTTGESLHKRGYRIKATEAPMRETLAAALVNLARFRAKDILYDPFCGSGTIAIEAALMSARRAPGMSRRFLCEGWSFIEQAVWRDERSKALDLVRVPTSEILASDNDPQAVELTMENAKRAGVESYVKVTKAEIADFNPVVPEGVIVTNPPYGERLLETTQARELYRVLGNVTRPHPKLRVYVITSHEQFEADFGRSADKKRKLYNGSIKCDLYQYFK